MQKSHLQSEELQNTRKWRQFHLMHLNGGASKDNCNKNQEGVIFTILIKENAEILKVALCPQLTRLWVTFADYMVGNNSYFSKLHPSQNQERSTLNYSNLTVSCEVRYKLLKHPPEITAKSNPFHILVFQICPLRKMFHLLQIWTHQDKKEGKRKKKRRGRSKWNAEVQKADSPPIPLIPPIRLCHTQGQGVWGRLAGGQAVKALHSLTWATIQRVTHPLPEESLIQSRSLQVLLIIKYTHAEQELYFKVRLSSGGGG